MMYRKIKDGADGYLLSYFIFSLALFTYIVLKSNNLLFTDDEGFSLFDVLYMNVGYLFGAMPNTHLINSFFLFFTAKYIGFYEIGLRIHSVLSFIIFSWVVYNFSLEIYGLYKRIAFVLLITLHPFMIDYFSLARGYALSLALMMVSLYFLYKYFISENKLKRNLYQAVFFSALSTISCYIMFSFYVVLLMIYFFDLILLKLSKPKLINFVSSVLYEWKFWIINLIFSIGILYITLKLKPGLLGVAWPYTSFLGDTVYSLIETFSINKFSSITIFFSALLILLSIAVALSLYDSITRKKIDKGSLFSIVLLMISLLFIVQFHLFNIPYLSYRGAIFLYPIFVLTVFYSFDALAHNPILSKFLSTTLVIIALLVSINFIQNLSWNRGIMIFPNRFYELSQDIKNQQKDVDEISLGVGKGLAGIMNYYKFRCHLDGVKNIGNGYHSNLGSYYFYGHELINTGKYDYFVIGNEEIQDVQNFQAIEVIKRYPEMGLVLAKSK